MASEVESLSRIKAIVFDFDGVILESTEIKTEAFVELFGAHPEHLAAIRQHHLDNLGVSRFRKFEWIYRNLLHVPLSPAESERLGREFSTLVFDRMLRCPATPGALELLQVLRGRMPVWVASGTPQDELDRLIEARDLGGYFGEIWGSPTPKEEVLHRMVKKHELLCEEVLMVGDGVTDHQAALAAGVEFLARESPGSGQSWAERNVPFVRDLTELAPLLDLAHR